MADNCALREGTGKLTKFRSVELEGGIHLLIAGLADAEGNLLGSSSAPLPVSVEGGITIGDITLSNVEISNDVGNPIPVIADQIGEVQTSPTANTVLDRLKILATLLAGGLPASLGAKTAAQSLPVTLSTDGAFAVNFGAKADVVAPDDIGNYSHIALLKRVASRLSSIIALLPTALTSGGGLRTGLVDALPAGTNLLGKIGIDQTTPGTTDAVWVKSQGHLATVTTTRPNDTTAYTAGDALGDTNGSAILEFTNMARTSGGNIMITSASMRVDLSSIPSGMAGLKLHLFSSSPTAVADNAVWDLVANDRDKYMGYVQLGTPAKFGSTLFVESNSINKHIQLTGTSIFCIPVLDAGFTPSASTVRQFKMRSIDL